MPVKIPVVLVIEPPLVSILTEPTVSLKAPKAKVPPFTMMLLPIPNAP